MESYRKFRNRGKERKDDTPQASKGGGNLSKNEKVTTKNPVPASQEESQTKRTEWGNQEDQHHNQTSRFESSSKSAHPQLDHKRQDLEGEKKVFEDENVRSEESIQGSEWELRTKVDEYHNQISKLNSKVKSVRRQLNDLAQVRQKEISGFEHEKARYEESIQASREKLSTQEYEHCNQISRLNSELKSVRRHVNDLAQVRQREISDFEHEKARYKEMIQASQDESKSQRAALEDQLRVEICRHKNTETRTRQSCAENISRMQTQHTNREMALESKYKEEQRRMREEHESAMRQVTDEIEFLQAHFEQRENDFSLEITQLEEFHKAKQNEMEEHFEVHESQLKQVHKQQCERLQKDIYSRNKALIARENYSSITDGELKSVFSDLVREVDALARFKWTSNRSPWTDELLSRTSDITKRLQRHVLNDTIWDVLFKYVFCSPFRVFGEEGSVLESQWNKAFGKDPKATNNYYSWPEVSFDAERWRYETMRQGQEALKIDTSEYDPRAKLRRGFQSSIRIICEELGGHFGNVSKVDEKTEQTIKEIAQKAARMCIAFGTQRCRIFMVIKDLKTTEEVKEGADRQDEQVELLTQPELRRIGDADGQSLDKEQTVAGCEGEIKRFLYK